MITYIAGTAHYNEVRLLHAKAPGPNFRTDFDRYPALWGDRLCK